IEEHLRETVHPPEGRAEIVGDRVAERLELPVRELQRVFCAMAFGDVARDLRESDELSAPVGDGGDDDVREKTRAILAHAPALVLVAPLGRRGAELRLGLAVSDVFGRIEL